MAKNSVDLFLDDFSNEQRSYINKIDSDKLIKYSCYCWNISNPSIERARQQVLWLRSQPFDILILTEAKNSTGCNYIEKYFKACGFHVLFSKPEGDEYGTLIISRLPFERGVFSKHLKSPRVASIQLLKPFHDLEIVGIYVPNDKEKGKKLFMENLMISLKQECPRTSFIFCGDFNIIEPDHIPHYSKFESWEYDFYRNLKCFQLYDAFRILNPKAIEYSWVGHTGDGYRYDHCFVSKDLIPRINKCYYNHEPRNKRLSDHSCLVTTILTK